MEHTIMLIPTGTGVGLNSVAKGLFRTFANHGVKVGFYKPFNDPSDNAAFSPDQVEEYLSRGHLNELLEAVMSQYETHLADNAVVIVQGMIASDSAPYAEHINSALVKSLDAKMILVAAPGKSTPTQLENNLVICIRAYGGVNNRRVLGVIINKLCAPTDENGDGRFDLTQSKKASDIKNEISKLQKLKIFHTDVLALLGCIPWKGQLIAPRAKDVALMLGAEVIFPGEIDTRRVMRIALCARNAENMLDVLKPGALIITSGDRADIILATCLASLSGVNIAALLLTGGYPLPKDTFKLADQAIITGLPILKTQEDSFRTAIKLHNLNIEIPKDDLERIERSNHFIAERLDGPWIKSLLDSTVQRQFSPAAFRYKISHQAKTADKCILLPEGNEPRTIEAATICASRGITRTILLGESDEIKRIVKNNNFTWSNNISIIDPDSVRDNYIDALVTERKHKGLTKTVAKERLLDNVMLGTMMLYKGEVDGLVSGALHTTANTIRPALQVIKTAKTVSLVSSVFFMCLPDQVLVYGDCAINTDPTASQLADIAIQSADTAKKFGITPIVAMISYSTGQSGAGRDVEKVSKATQLVKKRRPDIIVDGPLQYDTALNEDVAKKKAPDSCAAGKATVIVFPDLNTGNTTYKAVQRSADVLSVGPILQGLNKPVNDLSRGASVDDIVYTIAITAMQAK